MDLFRILLIILVAAVAYWILVPLAGLPVIVGVVAALLILVAALSPYYPRGPRV